MNVGALLQQYFPNSSDNTIDVFDAKNIHSVYERIIRVLTQHVDIETSVLQAMSYCFYEILDNVLTHSGKEIGSVITHYEARTSKLSFLIADDGIGIQKSLSANNKYVNISESDALGECIKDSVTDGKGMGFGLYSSALLARDAGMHFEIKSGNHRLVYNDQKTIVTESDFWQGTIVYMELMTDKEIDPNRVVANRTDVVAEYNETFLKDNDLEELW